jgi:hypothetical protein
MKRKLKKQDITKTTLTISVTKKALDSQEITSTKFTINLQEWIKKTPEEQIALATTKINSEIEELVDFNWI